VVHCVKSLGKGLVFKVYRIHKVGPYGKKMVIGCSSVTSPGPQQVSSFATLGTVNRIVVAVNSNKNFEKKIIAANKLLLPSILIIIRL
jgi:hypothetical protein